MPLRPKDRRRDRHFETPIRNTQPVSAKRLQADQSENYVLLALLMACWRWLTMPLPAAAWSPSYPLDRPAPAALPAQRPRFFLLAPIHVPWRLRSSPPLA